MGKRNQLDGFLLWSLALRKRQNGIGIDEPISFSSDSAHNRWNYVRPNGHPVKGQKEIALWLGVTERRLRKLLDPADSNYDKRVADCVTKEGGRYVAEASALMCIAMHRAQLRMSTRKRVAVEREALRRAARPKVEKKKPAARSQRASRRGQARASG